MIETERLVLRAWRDEDLDPFAALLADPHVADWLGGVQTRDQARQHMARNNAALAACGHGRLALAKRFDGGFVGYCGVAPIPADIPQPPGLEIGWALATAAWGQGYAVEAARAVIAEAFSRGPSEIAAYTTTGNARSQAVMRRLGMRRAPDRDFDHPRFPSGHPLRRHVVFVTEP